MNRFQNWLAIHFGKTTGGREPELAGPVSVE